MERLPSTLSYDVLLTLSRIVDRDTLKSLSLLNRELYRGTQWILWRSCRLVLDNSMLKTWHASGQEEMPEYLSFICDGRRATFVRRLSIHMDNMLEWRRIMNYWDASHRPQLLLRFLDVLKTELRALSNLRWLSVFTWLHQSEIDAFLNDYSPIGGYDPSLLYDPNRYIAKEPFWLRSPPWSCSFRRPPTRHVYGR